MVILSKYPIDEQQVRTFQHFRWVDMPGALLPSDPQDTDGDGNTSMYYNTSEVEVFRLSSKSHWDIPVNANGEILHILASHPTPPVFDDGIAEEFPSTKVADFNGLRNHDEIRFFADYIAGGEKGAYIYSDADWEAAGNSKPETPSGGMKACSRFIIAGDQNADPSDGGDSFKPILLLLDNELVQSKPVPRSDGAAESVDPNTKTDIDTKTAVWQQRADYALPSTAGFDVLGSFVYWPVRTDLQYTRVLASDHRSVVVDLKITTLDGCAATVGEKPIQVDAPVAQPVAVPQPVAPGSSEGGPRPSPTGKRSSPAPVSAPGPGKPVSAPEGPAPTSPSPESPETGTKPAPKPSPSKESSGKAKSGKGGKAKVDSKERGKTNASNKKSSEGKAKGSGMMTSGEGKAKAGSMADREGKAKVMKKDEVGKAKAGSMKDGEANAKTMTNKYKKDNRGKSKAGAMMSGGSGKAKAAAKKGEEGKSKAGSMTPAKDGKSAKA